MSPPRSAIVGSCSKGACTRRAAHGPTLHRFLAEVAPGAVPSVLATLIEGATAWTSFEHVDGTSLEDELNAHRFGQVASVLAEIQVAASTGVVPGEVPRPPLTRSDRLWTDLQPRSTAIGPFGRRRAPDPRLWHAATPWTRFESFALAVAASEELALGGLPMSIDHVDLNVSNVLVTGDQLFVIDWEEAIVGLPACSVDRLLDDARDHDEWSGHGRSPTEDVVIEAYADAVPWGAPSERVSQVELAVRLNRIAFAGQALDFWRARGRPKGHPQLAAFCVDRIVEAWQSG